MRNIIPAPSKIILEVEKIETINGLYIPQKKNNKFRVVMIGEEVPAELLINIGDLAYLMVGEGDYTHNVITHNSKQYIISDYSKIVGKHDKTQKPVVVTVFDDTVILETITDKERTRLEQTNAQGLILTAGGGKSDCIKLMIGKAVVGFGNDDFNIKAGDYVYYSFGYFIAENWKTYAAVNLSEIEFYLPKEEEK